MNRVIVAFESEKNRQQITNLLASGNIPVGHTCRSGGEVIRSIKTMGGGGVVCGFKLSDMTAFELAENLDDEAQMLLIATPVQLAMCENEEIFLLPTPVNGGVLCGSVGMLLQMEERLLRKALPRRTPQEESLIRRAKQLLMEHGHLTEEQAHRMLQRETMDNGMKMVDTAKMMIAALDRAPNDPVF